MCVIFGREPGKLLLQNPSFSVPSQAVRCFEAKVHQASRVSVYLFFTSSDFFIVIPHSVGSGKSRKTKMRATLDVWWIQLFRPTDSTATVQTPYTSFRFRGCCRIWHSYFETHFVCVQKASDGYLFISVFYVLQWLGAERGWSSRLEHGDFSPAHRY